MQSCIYERIGTDGMGWWRWGDWHEYAMAIAHPDNCFRCCGHSCV